MIKSVLLSNALIYMSFTQSANAAPGDHLGTEQTVLIPRIDLATHYRSNVYLEEGEVGGGEPVQSTDPGRTGGTQTIQRSPNHA